MSLRIKVLLVVGTVFVSGILTYRCTSVHQSCVDCRGVRHVSERSVFGIRFSTSESRGLPTAVPVGHVHKWWRYSTTTFNVLSPGVASKAHRFADGKDY